jgi:hypothetical protein
MGDGLLTESKRSNSTFIMLYLCHEMDVNYLVVQEMINIFKHNKVLKDNYYDNYYLV